MRDQGIQERQKMGQKAENKEGKAFESIVQKAMKGNRQALSSLCREIAKGVLIRVRLLYPHQMADVEDIAQESLCRVCEKIHSLKDPVAFLGWLNSIVVNEVRQYIRRTSKQAEVLYLEDYINDVPDENEEYMPLEFQLREEESRTIKAIIDTLPDQQREAIVLHYYEELNVTETGEIMNISHQGVSLYLKLGRDKIKKELIKRSKEPEKDRLRAIAAWPIAGVLSQSLQMEAKRVEAQSLDFELRAETRYKKIIRKSARAIPRGVALSLKAAKMAASIAVAGGMMTALVVAVLQGNEFPRVSATAAYDNYSVIFSGGEMGFDHLNPDSATADTGGQLYADCNWTITTVDGGETLYSGPGSVVKEPFSLLGDGEYVVNFFIEDDAGRALCLYSSFTIMEWGQ